MHRSESDELTSCVACGAEVSIALDRSYALDEQHALCMQCALSRGGRYDEHQDRWIELPRLDGRTAFAGQRN